MRGSCTPMTGRLATASLLGWLGACPPGSWAAQAVPQLPATPVLHQQGWWCAALLVLVLCLIATAFKVRLNQAQRRLRHEMEATHHERERIARDLHDTLLQAVQALLFRLELWEDDEGLGAAHRAEISALVTQTRAIVIEGRDRILMLRRADPRPVDLVEDLCAIEYEACTSDRIRFEVCMEGKSRSLTLEAHEQLVDIAREAVRNAYRHAHPSRVAVTVEYGRSSLRMCVADDGIGLDPRALERQCAATVHFGLTGMRERAQQLGATFSVTPNGPAGTCVVVVVPARIAYRSALARSHPSSAVVDA